MHKVEVLCDSSSWILKYINNFFEDIGTEYSVKLIHNYTDISEGVILFILSYSKIIPKSLINTCKHALVVHESDLPSGKGWSPLTWQILEGKNMIPITLFEADEGVDSGHIYLKDTMKFAGHELVSDLRKTQASFTFMLCKKFLSNYESIVKNKAPQRGVVSYYAKRTPIDSKLDFNKTINEQFNLLRVVDNDNYPAFFEHQGKKYILKIYEQLEPND